MKFVIKTKIGHNIKYLHNFDKSAAFRGHCGYRLRAIFASIFVHLEYEKKKLRQFHPLFRRKCNFKYSLSPPLHGQSSQEEVLTEETETRYRGERERERESKRARKGGGERKPATADKRSRQNVGHRKPHVDSSLSGGGTRATATGYLLVVGQTA